MDPRTAAHVLTRIAALLELNGENRFKARAYATAAKSVSSLDTDDIGPLLRSGALESVPGLRAEDGGEDREGDRVPQSERRARALPARRGRSGAARRGR